MTSIREQLYQVAAADTGIGGVVGQLADAAAGLRGGEGSAPPPAPNPPWAYLGMLADVPRWPLFSPGGPLQPSSTLTSGFQWWLYDSERAGYTRLRALAQRLRLLYGADRMNTTLWTDPATGEDVYGLQWAGLSQETADPASGQLLLLANWQLLLAYRQTAVGT